MKNQRFTTIASILLVLIQGSLRSANAAEEPFADIHLHFNWDQKEIISAAEAVSKMKSNSVVLATVSSTPTRLALELSEAGGDWLLPFFSPYLTPQHKHIWTVDENVLVEAEKGLASGKYKGIGELHIWSGFRPRPDNKILQGLLRLAEQYRVPFLIHTEASSHRIFKPICEQHPRVRFLWAHAGGKLTPSQIDQLMQTCPNVWSEVSVRDPWRYDTLVDDNHRLLPGWIELFNKYPDRFMTGTDPVWSVTKVQSWAQADDGWSYYDKLMRFHREWLQQLDPVLEEKIRLTNAQVFLLDN